MAEEDQAIGLPPLEHFRVPLLAFLFVLRVADQHAVAFTLRGFFNALENQREERVGDVRHRHNQFAGAMLTQVLGNGVWREAEALHGLQHFPACARGDNIGPAQHPRDGCGRHAGPFGDVVDSGHG